MRFYITQLPRPADDVDFSSATTAKQTGPAKWASAGELDIPFDRKLTAAEAAAVELLLTSADNTEASVREQCANFLANPSPTTAQNSAHLKLLTRLLLDQLDRRQV